MPSNTFPSEYLNKSCEETVAAPATPFLNENIMNIDLNTSLEINKENINPNDPLDAVTILPDTTYSITPMASRKRLERKTSTIFNTVGNLPAKERYNIMKKSLDMVLYDCQDEITFSNCDTIFEGKLCAGVLRYFKTLKDKLEFRKIFKMLFDMFGDELCDDINFLKWVAKKLGHRQSIFILNYSHWKRMEFVETRGRKVISLEIQQLVCNVWFVNSIPSVDCRNGRESVSIRKSQYFLRHHKDVQHEQPIVEKKKRSTIMLNSTRRVVTCTNEKIVELLVKKHGVSLSIGTVWNYTPFYITYPTEKERGSFVCVNLV